MPITALSPSAVRAIGSLSVISDPCSVVKELLDNALDASATSVTVEISQNTLDVIHVKDNGYGVQAEDYAVLCKRSFTSKIQTVEDLRSVGSRSLGFRGEALASICEISGGLVVTTRTESESVGACLKYDRAGGFLSSQRVSHPVGSTFRVIDLLKHIPVRRQTALKNVSKTMASIRKVLQAYAVAQPSKRLSLKVLKAKSEEDNWIYAPPQDASLLGAALKVAGSDAISCCSIRAWPLSDAEQRHTDSGDFAELPYELTALLPNSGTDYSKVNNCGQYVSVDGRPLSTRRGVAHEIVKLYKSYLRSAGSRTEHSSTIKDPLLIFQIRSSTYYDVNIEPSKDDVLFEDWQTVLSLVESLFRSVYGQLLKASSVMETDATGDNGIPSSQNGFEILLFKSPGPDSVSRTVNDPESVHHPFLTPSPQLKSPQLRHILDREHRQQHIGLMTPQISDHRTFQDRQFVNPWSIAKINGPALAPNEARRGPANADLPQSLAISTRSLSPSDNCAEEHSGSRGFLMSERRSPALDLLTGSLNNEAVEEALDFERRKKEAMQEQRQRMRGYPLPKSETSIKNILASSDQNRYPAAQSALAIQPERSPEAQQSSSAFQERTSRQQAVQIRKEDSRTYLMLHRSSPHSKLGRVPTSRLALENISKEKMLHNIELRQFVDLSLLSQLIRQLSATDIYICNQSGNFINAFVASNIHDKDPEILEHRLISLIEERYELKNNLNYELRFDFQSIITSARSGDVEAA